MLLKYLRFAVSALCLVASLLLIALWVRSYQTIDSLMGPLIGAQGFSLLSDRGRLNLVVFIGGDEGVENEWGQSSYAVATANWEIIGRPWAFNSSPSESWYVRAPHWFPAFVVAALASVPWFRRFSLRTLLIAMTLVAVLLGIIVALNSVANRPPTFNRPQRNLPPGDFPLPGSRRLVGATNVGASCGLIVVG